MDIFNKIKITDMKEFDRHELNDLLKPEEGAIEHSRERVHHGLQFRGRPASQGIVIFVGTLALHEKSQRY